MKRTVAIVLVIVIVLGVWWFFQGSVEAPVVEETPHETLQTFSSDLLGVSFTYPEGYVLTERDIGNGERKAHAITLIHGSNLPLPEAGEGPPAIVIEMFQNDLDKQTTEGWIINTSASNYKLGNGVLTPVSLGGENALRYSWDGLYQGQTIALAREKWVYAFSVTMLTPTDQIRSDFEKVVDSVIFK